MRRVGGKKREKDSVCVWGEGGFLKGDGWLKDFKVINLNNKEMSLLGRL